MSEKEYKIKCENLFKKNTILLNQQVIDAEQIRALQKQNGELTDKLTKAKQFIRDFLSVAIDYIDREDKNYSLITEAEQFLKENA